MGEQLYGLNAEQKAFLLAMSGKVNAQSTKSKATGLSGYRPGLTQTQIGKLTSTVSDTTPGTFQPWAAPTPDDPSSVEAALTDNPDIPVFSWTFGSGNSLSSGTKVIVSWIAGRWYVTGSETCPGTGGGGGGSDG